MRTGLFASGGAIAVSLLLGYFKVYPQARGVIAARNWTAVPCTISTSRATRVDRNKDASSPRYFDLALSYSFQANGRTVVGDRRSFAYPRGMATTCYYNPAAPDEAVLDRGLTYSAWLMLVPLAALALGVIAVAATIERNRELVTS